MEQTPNKQIPGQMSFPVEGTGRTSKKEMPETTVDLLTPKAREAWESAVSAEKARRALEKSLEQAAREDESDYDRQAYLSGTQIQMKVEQDRKLRARGLTDLSGGEDESDPPEVTRGRRGKHGQPLGGSKTTKHKEPKALGSQQSINADGDERVATEYGAYTSLPLSDAQQIALRQQSDRANRD